MAETKFTGNTKISKVNEIFSSKFETTTSKPVPTLCQSFELVPFEVNEKQPVKEALDCDLAPRRSDSLAMIKR